MIIPVGVEKKIRYLQNKYPSTEWSGVLFYTYEGSFKNKDLVITCVDIFPMDLGTSTYTEFEISPEVTAYIAGNVDTLFGCEMALIHSHHQMAAFFSGTDLSTLQSEGNDTNNFVSLIVNNAGTYSAAITRKVHVKTHYSYDADYTFFGSETRENVNYAPKEREYDIIEYFMLDIEKPDIGNPYAYIDNRFADILRKKEERKKYNDMGNINSVDGTLDVTYFPVMGKPSIYNAKQPQQLKLFDSDINLKGTIQIVFERIVLCSLLSSHTKNIREWVDKEMMNEYNKVFNNPSSESFIQYAEWVIEWYIDNIQDEYNNEVDFYDIVEKLSDKFTEYLDVLNPNPYISAYINILNEYLDVEK